MDFSLRCNSLKCRSQLTESAVVTTCSHVFCTTCSETLGLSSPPGVQRLCPACQTILANPDDAVLTQLNPTEDYKTSILSGLNPTTIMECAGRGLAFWSYQSTQEIVYQEYLAKSLTDKYGNLSLHMDKIINDANAQIENLNQKINYMQTDQDKLRVENGNLAGALREKTRKHQQSQELYERLKRREMTAVTQSAAFNSVDEVLQSAANGDCRREQSEHSGKYARNITQMMPPPQRSSGMDQSFRIHNDSGVIPSQHRTRLGALPTGMHQFSSRGPGTPQSQLPLRRPLGHVGGNISRAGYGMSAGIKVGRQNASSLGSLEGLGTLNENHQPGGNLPHHEELRGYR